MKYNYERDARAFGFPPAFFISMIEHEQAQSGTRDEAYERALTRMYYLHQLLREHSDMQLVRARRHQRFLSIAVTAVVMGAVVAVLAALL